VVEETLARVLYEQYDQAAAAVAKCPTKCIRDFTDGYPEGSSFPPPVVPVKGEAA